MLKKHLILVGGLFIGIQVGFSFPENYLMNRSGSAAVELADSPQIGQPKFSTYKVKKGATLHFIAKQYGVTVDDILQYNPEAKNGIKKGQILRIPSPEYLQALARQAEKEKEEAEAVLPTHTVKAGETLYGIARQYNCDVTELVRLNPDSGNGLRIGMVLTIPVSAAQQETAPVANQEEKYITHLVESGETFWSLERKFQTSREELIRLNPALQEGLKSGLRIRIPMKNVPEVQAEPVDESAFTRYTVQKGETVFGLAKRFDVSIPELKQANPVLDYRGLVEGESILIPNRAATLQPETSQTGSSDFKQNVARYAVQYDKLALPADCMPDPNARLQTYNVALMLPFYLLANDTVNQRFYNPEISGAPDQNDYSGDADSLVVKSARKIYPRSESFVQFYEGVLLAVDSLKQAGMNVKLHVYDTNQSAANIQSILRKPEMRNMNLLIGPVFPELQGPVAEFAQMNHIPMVSPLSAGGTLEQANPFYYKVNPTKDYLVKQTASYIADQYFDKNLVVLQMGDYKNTVEAQLVNLVREKRFSSGYRSQTSQVLFREYNLPSEGVSGLKTFLSKEQPNIFIIPSETEAQISVAVTNLNTIAENYPIRLVGLSGFQRYKSIQTEYYHHIHLNLLSPYYVDYQSPMVNQFIRKFRRNFLAEPTQFSFQGYDIAFYFLSAMFNYGKDYTSCLSSHRVNLTQSEFYFEKVTRDGGYMNQGLFILEYEPDYSIKLQGYRGIPFFNGVQ